MPCIDFGLTSFCSQVSNIAVAHGNAQAFLTWQIAGYNHPAFGGCSSANWPNGGWFAGRVNAWTNTLAGVTGVAYRRQLIAKIDWANCMMNECCGQGGLAIYGCMDDGTKGNDYINNQGTYANPQYGSVLPLDAQGNPQPALNVHYGATQDNGNCIYVQQVSGCKDPNASNYDPNADTDCGNSHVSEFNIEYTNWQGIQPSGSWTPYGDTSCCTYGPLPCTGCSCVDYNYRDGSYIMAYTSPVSFGGFNGNILVHTFATSTYSGGDNVIGEDKLIMRVPGRDVKGNNWTLTDWQDDSQGYTITIWDMYYNFLGKWRYDFLLQSYQGYNGAFVGVNNVNETFDLEVSNVTHLAGPNPVVDFSTSVISLTNAYIKVETAYSNTLASGYESACNATIWGNAQFPIYGTQEMPHICDGGGAPSPILGYMCHQTWGTHNHLDNSGNTLSVFPDKTSCTNCSSCRCGSSNINNSGTESINGMDVIINIISEIPLTRIVNTKGSYVKNNNQTVELVYDDFTLSSKEENGDQIVSTFTNSLTEDSTKNIFNITFKTKDGYYYSKSPSLTMNFPGMENYKIKVESESKNARGYVTEKTFNVNYKNTGFDVFESDSHNIMFTTKIAKEVDISTKVKEITALRIDTSSIDSSGESRNISVVGTPGSTFSLTIKDKNGRNILPYSDKITKTIKTAISASNTLELNNATGLEVGMVVLNGQRRNVKITGITKPIRTNVDAINETSTTYISISSHLTFSADASITFAKEIDITEVAIPSNGIYSFTQEFPSLEKFKRTLKTAASSTTSLTLDYTKDLENDMRITDTGGLVDGNNPTIGLTKLSTTVGVLADGVTIKVSDAQTIADETELTFEMPDNRYDITLYPLMAILGDDIPRYSSTDCDTLPTYSIYQYIDPIVEIAPSSALSNVTVDGTVTFTGRANRNAGTNGDITISMTATKSDGLLATSRNPRFSSVDSESSDFSNTLNTVTKRVREGDCNDRDIVHLNNVAGIRVGMIITGGGININKTITVKSITGTAVKLSEKQTIRKDDMLTFSSMFNMHISSLTATLSPNGGLATGICTIAGTGKITTFGIDSFTSTFNFDNFLSIPG